jgi:hypothetical protein
MRPTLRNTISTIATFFLLFVHNDLEVVHLIEIFNRLELV